MSDNDPPRSPGRVSPDERLEILLDDLRVEIEDLADAVERLTDELENEQ